MTLLLAWLAFSSHILVMQLTAYSGFDDVELELDQRVRTFSEQVRCLVCQNETLAESRAELAVDLRREIREQMKEGRTDTQITAFLTDRYGDFVLYRPPVKASTYPLWFGPFVLLAGALWALYRGLARWTTRPQAPPLSTTDRKRARQLLGAADGEESA
jgi:cytochrome c-type biogenesis protein CcmH